VATLDGFSAHADRDEILRWASAFRHPPRRTFIVHGEPQASRSLAELLHARLGWEVCIPHHGETAALKG
jgi:metallo-beta-lactamase family protein